MASKNHPNGYWSADRIKDEALKYKTRTEFCKNSKAAYSAAVDKGILQVVCSHMPKSKRNPRKWSPDRIMEEAKKFKTRKAFQIGSGSAYRAAHHLGIIDSVSHHMLHVRVPKGYWNEIRIRDEAKKYKTRTAFRTHSVEAYTAAYRNRLMDSVCKHMELVNHPEWTQEEIREEAKKYSSRSDFEKGNHGAYKAALRENIIDEVCSHMLRKGHRFKRAIYIYEFADKSVYVGLTNDYERRHRQHMLTSKRIINKAKHCKYILIRMDKWISPEKAAREEAKVLRSYSKRGWKVINVSKPGSIGGSYKRWTHEALLTEVQKYRTLADFQNYSRGAYHAAWKSGILNSLCAMLKRTKQANWSWTKNKVLEEAKKYNTRAEFVKNAGGAYHAAQRLRILNKACLHMHKLTQIKNYWTRTRIFQVAKTCKTRTEFMRKYSGAYNATIRLSLLPSIHKLLSKQPRKEYWTLERLSLEAGKYMTRMDFKRNSPSAYVMAGRKGIRDKLYAHMHLA